MTKRFLACLLLILFLGLAQKSQAQILPPTLDCITPDFTGDIQLDWSIPSNSCGSFNAYIIYTSVDPLGPFVPLDTITDSLSTQYLHIGAGTSERYYYMVTDANCTGNRISSDTLDSNIPIGTEINFVSVINQEVVVFWTPSPSPETDAYLLEWESANGFVTADTAFGGNASQVVHTGSLPADNSEGYLIRAVDKCGNESLISTTVHRTMFLQGQVDRCTRDVDLTWTNYEGWSQVDRQLLWIGVGGGSLQVYDTLNPNASQFTFLEAVDGETYNFAISAWSPSLAFESFSNEWSVQINIVEPMDYIYLRRVSLNDLNEPEVYWLWDDHADIQSISILNGGQKTNLTTASTEAPSFPLSEFNEAFPVVIEPNGFYRLQTQDSCGGLANSNLFETVFLQGAPKEDFINRLEWRTPEIGFGTIQSYRLMRSLLGGQAIEIASLDPNITKYEDAIDRSNQKEAIATYYIEALVKMEYPNGTSETVASQSNRIEIKQFSDILLPNAFVPGGFNDEFKPLVVFGEGGDYHFQVFNRWGKMLFETTEINQGWDGESGGKIQPQGVYICTVRIVQPDGELLEKRGSFVLIK